MIVSWTCSGAQRGGEVTAQQNIRSLLSNRPQPLVEKSGAGEGNRTLVISLEGCCSTIELHPRRPHTLRALAALGQERCDRFHRETSAGSGNLTKHLPEIKSSRAQGPPSPWEGGRVRALRAKESDPASPCGSAPSQRRLVGEVGLEPTKAKPADLQSAPFAARDTPPSSAAYLRHRNGLGKYSFVGSMIILNNFPGIILNACSPGVRDGHH
jgi:hypothetical protein